MNGYIKYFENGGQNMSFLIKDGEVSEKYKQVWDVLLVLFVRVKSFRKKKTKKFKIALMTSLTLLLNCTV